MEFFPTVDLIYYKLIRLCTQVFTFRHIFNHPRQGVDLSLILSIYGLNRISIFVSLLCLLDRYFSLNCNINSIKNHNHTRLLLVCWSHGTPLCAAHHTLHSLYLTFQRKYSLTLTTISILKLNVFVVRSVGLLISFYREGSLIVGNKL